MRNFLLGIFVFGAFAAGAVDPSVSGVAVTQSDTGFVTISYDLSGADAIVTLDLMAGETRLDTHSLSGDVNMLVSAGAGKKVYWRPAAGTNLPGDMQLTARVRLWTESTPPDYMSLPLMPSTVRRYYATTNDLPYPVVSDHYRTRAILFRRIPARGVTFNMGSTASGLNPDPNRQSNEDLHEVSFTNDYYLSVFPVTQGQWRNGIGPSSVGTVYSGVGSTSLLHRDAAAGLLCPVDNCSSFYIQAVYDGQAPNDLFKVDDKTWLQVMKEYVGYSYVRLPTEAEWEYACRAGDDGAIYDTSASIDDLAWHAGNSEGTTHPVGLKKPNLWGLYDMLGNIYEVCIDHYVANLGTSAVTNPYAQGGACTKVCRGGSYATASSQCRCAKRTRLCDSGWGDSSKHPECGFRLYCRIP